MRDPMPTIYAIDDQPAAGSVPLTVIVLTKDEEVNIGRCLSSLAWAAQVVVVDSGSTDATVALAREAGAYVVETSWRGYGAQREFALRMKAVSHDWVYFVDADEWVSAPLAAELRAAIQSEQSAFTQYKRLVFQGRWIAHCGWYPSSRITLLMQRNAANFTAATFSEHASVRGKVGHLKNDIVDQDLKGLKSWLHKHVDYGELEAQCRREKRSRGRGENEPWARHVTKNLIAPRLPCRPLLQFVYMYLFRAGFLDGRVGLRFCFYQSWFQVVVEDLRRDA
jgi:glycosyltransferase involved in cell wall biosynthesis